MRFNPGDIAISKAERYPPLGIHYLVIGVGMVKDMSGIETEMIHLDNPNFNPAVKAAIHFYTPNEIKIMLEMEKNK